MFHLFKSTFNNDPTNPGQLFIDITKIEAMHAFKDKEDGKEFYILKLTFTKGSHGLAYETEEDARAEMSQVLYKSGISIEDANKYALEILIDSAAHPKNRPSKEQFLRMMMDNN